MFHLVGFDTNSRCGAAMWCGVVWCDVSQDGVLIEVKYDRFLAETSGLALRRALGLDR
jgi:hypothetical protein